MIGKKTIGECCGVKRRGGSKTNKTDLPEPLHSRNPPAHSYTPRHGSSASSPTPTHPNGEPAARTHTDPYRHPGSWCWAKSIGVKYAHTATTPTHLPTPPHAQTKSKRGGKTEGRNRQVTSRRQHLTTDPRPKYLHPLSLVGEGCHANKAQASSYNESPENNKGKTKDKETPRSHPTGTRLLCHIRAFY